MMARALASTLLGILLVPGLVASATAQADPLSANLDLPDAVVVTPGSEYTLPVEMFQLVGFDALQVFKFAIEYDPTQLEVLEVRPGNGIAGWPLADFVVDLQPGRAVVVAITDTPVPIADRNLVEFDIRADADLYEGERPGLGIGGAQPGDPPRFLATLGGAPIKIFAADASLSVSGGISCLAGDALGDGGFDAGDAVATLRVVTGLIANPDAALRCGADADADGSIDAGDAVLILRRAVGLSPPPARIVGAPLLRTLVDEGRLVLRFDGAAAVHGAQLRVRGAGITSVDTGTAPASAVRIGPSSGRAALASARPLADAHGTWSLALEARPETVLRIEELVLFGADGEELFRLDDRPEFALRDAPRATAPRLGNTPNPFNPRTTLWMDLPVAGRVRLELFDLRGRHRATLLDERRAEGRSQLEFDARVDGEVLPSGVYFVRLHTPAGTAVHRMTLLK